MSRNRSYLSGSQKRKLKACRDEDVKKVIKIDTMFQRQATRPEPICTKISCENEMGEHSGDVQVHRGHDTSCENESGGNSGDVQFERGPPATDTDSPPTTDSSSQLEENQQNTPFSTDRGLFQGKLNEETKLKIINSPPCKPQGPFPRDAKTKRSFSCDYYYNYTKTGQKIERFWLCYSPTLNSVYCEACWLFGDGENAWRDGQINDWQGLSKKIKVHETCAAHLNACITYSMWKHGKTLNTLLNEGHEQMKAIISRILDVTRTLTLCQLAFRGHRESKIGEQSGNFLNIIDLLSRYDPLLKAHLSNEKSKTKYLSPQIQNEMIQLLNDCVLERIISEIKQQPFFSIIVDTTPDISRKDQLSVVIRYLRLDLSKPDSKEIEIKESFLGFFEIRGHDADSFEREIITALEKMGIQLDRCRGQGYDGAASMSGQYSGLQSRIKARVPNAEFIHCSAHNLNLVLNDSVMDIVELQRFYEKIQSIYIFFSGSVVRWQQVNETFAADRRVTTTLKKLCPTRWSSRFDSLLSIKQNFINILQCLSCIILKSKKRAERDEASNLRKNMETFDFVLLLVFQSKVLKNINLISKLLQSPNADIENASQLLQTARDNLVTLRSNFETLVEEAKVLAKAWSIDPKLTSKRPQKVKKFFDELSSDHRIVDSLKSFQVTIFNASLDIFIQQLNKRFTSLQNINDYFSFLHPVHLFKLENENIQERAEKLVRKYESDLTMNLSNELISLKTLMSKEIGKKENMLSIKDLAKFLFIENTFLASSLPDVCTALQLYLTLPVTSATAERSFSKMKLIKTFLRNTMSESRLSALAVLSIEHETCSSLNLDEVVKKFLSAKRRRTGGTMCLL